QAGGRGEGAGADHVPRARGDGVHGHVLARRQGAGVRRARRHGEAVGPGGAAVTPQPPSCCPARLRAVSSASPSFAGSLPPACARFARPPPLPPTTFAASCTSLP